MGNHWFKVTYDSGRGRLAKASLRARNKKDAIAKLAAKLGVRPSKKFVAYYLAD